MRNNFLNLLAFLIMIVPIIFDPIIGIFYPELDPRQALRIAYAIAIAYYLIMFMIIGLIIFIKWKKRAK